MPTLRRRTVAAGALSVLVLLWATGVRGAPRQALHGHVPPAVGRLQPLERLPASNRLDLAIGLPLRGREALETFLTELYDPGSTNYHRYLNPAQFTERFGPSETDYQALIAFARRSGLTVSGMHPNRMLLDVKATVGNIEKAFHLKMHRYRHPAEPRTFYSPDVEPSLDVDVPVLSISGLDDFNLPRPMDLGMRESVKRGATFRPARTDALTLHTRTPDAIPYSTPYATGSGPNGAFIGGDFRAAYAPGIALTGAGEAVGLFELDGYYLGDILEYERLAGLPNVPITNVLLNGFDGTPGPQNVEPALDIEMAIAMAPGLSRIIVYQGRVPNDVFNRMATDNLARQLSCSWGFGLSIDPVRDQIFLQFAAQGQSLFQASGDLGAWPSTIYPPSDNPYLTVVGGTALTTTGPGGDWLSETTWPESGGGISTAYPIPYWQQGISMTANLGSTTMRNLPDVACLADSTIWVIVNQGQHGRAGGTSAAAPLWAAFTALINQQAALTSQPGVGFINPAIYGIGKASSYPAVFHDIVTGSNTNSSSPTRFFAGPGYDLCTGWGTPAGAATMAALLAPPGALRISPSANFTCTGRAGGPFSPPSQIYSLTNFGFAPLNWVAMNVPPLFDISPASGTLVPGGPAAAVVVTPSSLASNLPAGRYTGSLWFTNLNDRLTQTRLLTLQVVAPPLITSQPASQTVIEGMTAAFKVGIATNGWVSYQWQFESDSSRRVLSDGGNISGASGSALTVSNVTVANAGAYLVVVSNTAGVITSSKAYLSVGAWKPVITEQPLSQTALPGQTLSLTVSAIGSEPLFYRWQRNGAALSDGGNVSGASARTLTINDVSAANAGTYRVTVGNRLGVASSTGALVTVFAVTAPSVDLATMHSFDADNEGGNPNGLVRGEDGNFYGTTQNGGTNASGILFRMTPAGAVMRLCEFNSGTDGAHPQAPLIQARDGNLYGTTIQGGTNGFGTVFRTGTNGGLAAIVSHDKPGGILPYAGVTEARDGDFYGAGFEGGTGTLYGAIYKVTAGGSLTTLYSFGGGADGGFPYAGLIQGRDEYFYGTAFKGGAVGRGSVFRMAANGLLTTLATLNTNTGTFPYAGLVQDADGSLYGVASSGGAFGFGTVFRMAPAGVLTNLYSFTGTRDGANPVATLLLGSDGNFYGTTVRGGAYGSGTVFRLSPAGVVTTLAHFDGYNGSSPMEPLAQGPAGNIYGAAPYGGADGAGTLFRLSVSGPPQITGQPASRLVFAGDTVLFSVAAAGTQPFSFHWLKNGKILAECATISGSRARVLGLTNVSLADAATYSVLLSNSLGSAMSAPAVLQVTSSPPFFVLQPTNRTVPPGSTVIFNAAALGNFPLTYRWRLNGTNLIDRGNLFGSATPSLVLTNVVETNNGIYSVVVSNPLASIVSSGAVLTVVPVSAPGTRLTTLHGFTGESDGLSPNGLLLASNGVLYGTTQLGGPYSGGTAFSLTTNGAFTTLAGFRSTSGYWPQARLTQGDDGNFYGTTRFGGTNFGGAIFRLTPEGSLSNLYSFTGGVDGGYPVAPLLRAADGDFYGTASDFGAGYYGTIFKITAGGQFTALYSFASGTDGGNPESGLVQAADGNFYGQTRGGDYGNGNVYRLTPGGQFTTIYSFTGGTDGYLPVGELVQGTDGKLYGATRFNRIQNFTFYGTIFKISTNGALSTLYALNYTDGVHPYAGLLEGADGNFYGTTYDGGVGGVSGNGTVFGIAPSGAYATLVSFDGFNAGAHPRAALVQGPDGALYGTTSTGGFGGHGTVFRLVATGGPQITTQPANAVAPPGGSARFSVAVFGAAPLRYQWRLNGTNLSDNPDLAGATGRILALSHVSASSAGSYSVVISNVLKSVTSANALLSVVSTPAFQTVQQTNQTLLLSWSTLAGRKYQLQFKPSLGALNWTNLGAIRTAATNTLTATDGIGANSQRYYRVLLLP